MAPTAVFAPYCWCEYWSVLDLIFPDTAMQLHALKNPSPCLNVTEHKTESGKTGGGWGGCSGFIWPMKNLIYQSDFKFTFWMKLTHFQAEKGYLFFIWTQQISKCPGV